MSQLERGCHQPSLSVLRALADSLGIRPDELILFAAGLPMPDDPVSTEDALRGDGRLTAAQRTALLAVLRSDVRRTCATLDLQAHPGVLHIPVVYCHVGSEQGKQVAGPAAI